MKSGVGPHERLPQRKRRRFRSGRGYQKGKVMLKQAIAALSITVMSSALANALDMHDIDIVGVDIDNPWAVAPIGPVPKQDGQS